MQQSDIINEAIKTKDIKRLRAAIAVTAYVDRNFSTSEFEDTVLYAESKGVKLKEDLIGELLADKRDPSEYTDEYFSDAIFELKENFCDERIEDVKKIGRVLYGEPASKPQPATLEKPQVETDSRGVSSKKATRRQKANHLPLVIILLAAVVIIVLMLCNR